MREVVHRVDRPRVAGVLVRDLADAVQRRIAQVDVAAGHVDPGAQRFRAVGELAGAHAREQIEILRHAAIAIWRIAAGFGQRAAVFALLLGAQIAHEGSAIADQLERALVQHAEIVRGVAQFVPLEAEPVHVVLDRLDVLDVFLGRIGVIETQMADAAEIVGDAEVQADRLGVSEMQIAVGFRREAGDDVVVLPGLLVLGHDLANEVIVARCFLGHGSCEVQLL